MKEKSIIAVTGPSGAGKTTLVNELSKRHNLAVPKHCTTREPRGDDNGLYRYLTHEEYANYIYRGEFFFSSGDGPEVKKEYGNFYGILMDDIAEAWKKSDTIIIYISYKDLEFLGMLKECGFNIDIIDLSFTNIEKGIIERISNNKGRNHTKEDIEKRVKCALEYEEKYADAIKIHAKARIYTDLLDIDATYQKAVSELGMEDLSGRKKV